MLRDRGPADWQVLRKLTHRQRSCGEPLEYLPAGWVAESLERLLLLVSVHER